MNPLFLYGLFKLSRAYIQSHATKGMKKILTKGDFEQIPMIKPPIDSQNKFATLVEKFDSLKSRYQHSLADLEALYGALSQHAFKGELDLSRIEVPQFSPNETQSQESLLTAPAPVPQRIELPELPVGFTLSGKGRQTALQYWFGAALNGLSKGGMFQPEKLIDAMNFRLIAMDDQELDFEGADYEVFKLWVFEALGTGKLAQVYDDAGNRIQLKSGQP